MTYSGLRIEEVTDGLFRLGSTYLGWFVLSEGGRFTVIDAAVPGYFPQLLEFLAAQGAELADIEAVILTHHHDDHRGNAERLRTEAAADVLIHEDDLEALTVRGKPPAVPLWRPFVLKYFLHLLRNGVIRTPPTVEATTFADGQILDVPGRPRVIHLPGHTGGSCGLLFEERDAFIAGDALVTMNLYTRAELPLLAPSFLNDDSEQALASLERIADLSATWLLPAHGNPWNGGVAEAVRRASEVGVY